jgi:undecaprenyl-diphosphatase
MWTGPPPSWQEPASEPREEKPGSERLLPGRGVVIRPAEMLFGIDDVLFHLLYARGGGPLTLVAAVFSALGEGWVAFALLPLFFLPRARRFAGWLGATLAVTAVLVFALKALLHRGRPFTVYTGLRLTLLNSPTDYSLPSGHAAGSFAFAFFVVEVLRARRPRPRYAVAASVGLVLFAACVGVSRVVLGFHFPLDVLAGTVLGTTVGAGSGRRFGRKTSHKTEVLPAPPQPQM